jgi:transglutaminase/protease-like cytokinesis protein 3
MIDLIVVLAILLIFSGFVGLSTVISLAIKQNRKYVAPRKKRFLNFKFHHLFTITITFIIITSQYKDSYNRILINYHNSSLYTWQEKPTPGKGENTNWPSHNNKLHPVVVDMPKSVETSIEAVAKYIAKVEKDPYQRIKALHDYVADRIAYDTESYFAGKYPPQDAQTVFKTHKAVCAGYANLLMELGRKIDEKIVVVEGISRNPNSKTGEEGHAWNAVEIDDSWYLIDVTWDSGKVSKEGFKKEYTSDYLLVPPEVMKIAHYPDNVDWQLLSSPITYQTFLEQPMMRPKFFAESFKLILPTSLTTKVEGRANIIIENPKNRWVLADLNKQGENSLKDCQVRRSLQTSISCQLPSPGNYEVSLFSSKQETGTYRYMGSLQFNYQQPS